MRKFMSVIGRTAMAGAALLLSATMVQAADTQIQVSGLVFQGPDSNFIGREAGPNYMASRDLESGIYPCTVAFCGQDTNGFYGKVTVSPEQVSRLDRNGDWTFRMLAKQTITAGTVDFPPIFGGPQSFPGIIIANGNYYVGCTIVQTLVATGDLLPAGAVNPATGQTVTGINNSGAMNVFGTWTINAGSTCVDSSNGRTVKVTGHGSITFDPINGAPFPTYAGVISFAGR